MIQQGTNNVYPEVEGLSVLLGFKTQNAGCCKVRALSGPDGSGVGSQHYSMGRSLSAVCAGSVADVALAADRSCMAAAAALCTPASTSCKHNPLVLLCATAACSC